MATLPPHLQQYVSPILKTDSTLNQQTRAYFNEKFPPPPIAGPKPQYDWRAKGIDCTPANVYADPAYIPWTQSGGVEYVDQPQIKLQRTFGRDGKPLNVQGNTIPHPTGRQVLKMPVNGREADSLLRRMTGHDPHRRPRGTVLAPTLMPDGSLGSTGEWGDTREIRGLSVETRGLEALNNMDIDRMGNAMLPFIRPSLHQWTERPVSYKKPTPFVREPIIPDSRAGIFYRPQDYNALSYYSEPLPPTPGSAEYYRRPESMEHLQLPRECNKESQARSIISAPVPFLSTGSLTERVDEVPFEDYGHNLPQKEQRVAPLMLTAIKRFHKKMQLLPSTAGYGAGLHDDNTVGDNVRFGTHVQRERAENKTTALNREQPILPLHGYTTTNDSEDFDPRVVGNVGVSVSGLREEDAVRRESTKQTEKRQWQAVQGDDEGDYASAILARQQRTKLAERKQDAGINEFGAINLHFDVDDGQDAVAGASRFLTPRDAKDVEQMRPGQRRDAFKLQQGGFAQLDDIGDLMDRYSSALPLSHKHAGNDRKVTGVNYLDERISDPELSALGDRQRELALKVRQKKDALTETRSAAYSHMVDDMGGGDISVPTFVSSPGDQQRRFEQLEARRTTAARPDFSVSALGLNEDEPLIGDRFIGGISALSSQGQQRQGGERVAEGLDWSRNLGAGVIEYESAAARVDTVVTDRQDRADRRKRESVSERVLGHIDEQVSSLGDRLSFTAKTKGPKRDGELIHDPHRGAFTSLAIDDFGIADSDFIGRGQQQRRNKKQDALPVDLSLGGYSQIETELELAGYQQQLGTREHYKPFLAREYQVAQPFFDQIDGDALTSLGRASVCAPDADRRVNRFRDREYNMSNSLLNHFYADAMDEVVANEQLIAPPLVHLSRVSEKQDGRESGVDAKLKARYRSESPRPRSHMEGNSRFGKMLRASPSQSMMCTPVNSVPVALAPP